MNFRDSLGCLLLLWVFSRICLFRIKYLRFLSFSFALLLWYSGIDSGDLLKVLFDEKEYHFAAMELRDLFGFGLGRDCINKTLSVKAIV